MISFSALRFYLLIPPFLLLLLLPLSN